MWLYAWHRPVHIHASVAPGRASVVFGVSPGTSKHARQNLYSKGQRASSIESDMPPCLGEVILGELFRLL
jgi:hypothetical protein